MRLLFMGTPDFAIPTLAKLDAEFPGCVADVISQPDAPQGRGRQLKPSAVRAWAMVHGLSTQTPETKAELMAAVATAKPDLIVVVAYGMILPKSITDERVCVNVHPSLLPRHRGATPIQAALLQGDAESGVCLIRMNEKMDEGDILARETDRILPNDTAGSLHDRYAQIGAELTCDYIRKWQQGVAPKGVPQDSASASYCQKIQKADLQLSPTLSAIEKHRRICAFSPKPGAYILAGNQRVKILGAVLERETLIPTLIQTEGKSPMSYSDYLLGHPEGISLC